MSTSSTSSMSSMSRLRLRAMAGLKLRVASVLVALAMAWVTGVGPAEANGVPVTIHLTYLDGVSNWGPTDASGTSVVVLREEEVELEVAGLPVLSGEAYEVWLAHTAGGDWLSVGKLTVDSTGSGVLEESIDLPAGLPEYPYDLLLITVEPEPDDSSMPSQKISIAGYFPGTHGVAASTATATSVPGGVQETVVAPSSTPLARGTATPVLAHPQTVETPAVTGTPGLTPSRLPKTGEPATGWWPVALGALLLIVGGAARAAVADRRHR